MRAGCAVLAAAALGAGGCAGTETAVVMRGALPPPPAPLRLADPGPERAAPREAALAERAAAALEAAGWPVTRASDSGTAGTELRLSFALRPEGTGAFVPREGADARWAAQPARRGLFAPARQIYTVELVAFDRTTGAEQARARASARQRAGAPDAVLARLAEAAAAALAAPAP